MDGVFEADKFLDWEWRAKEDEWKKFVKDEENTGPGGLNPGMICLQDKFTIAVCSDATDEDLAAVCATIPHFDKMEKFIVE